MFWTLAVCDVLMGIWCDVSCERFVCASSLKETRCVTFFLTWWTKGSERQKYFSSLSGSPVSHEALLLWQTESCKLRVLLYFAHPQEAGVASFIVARDVRMTGLDACMHTDKVHEWKRVSIIPNCVCLCLLSGVSMCSTERDDNRGNITAIRSF